MQYFMKNENPILGMTRGKERGKSTHFEQLKVKTGKIQKQVPTNNMIEYFRSLEKKKQ